MSTNNVIIAVPLAQMNNTESLNHHKAEYKNLQRAGISELQPALTQYAQAIEEEDASIARLNRENKTEAVVEKDDERDNTLAGTVHQFKSYLHHWEPEKVAAAKRLLNIYETFEKDAHSNYKKESEAIDNILQQMCGTTSGNLAGTGGAGGTTGGMGGGMTGGGTSSLPYTADVTLLGLAPWLDKLKQDNDEFKAIFDARQADRSMEELMKEVKDTRRKADAIFRNIVNMLNFLVMTNGRAQYETLISDINVTIKDWNDTLARRKAAAKKRKEKEAANNGENTNTTPETPTNNNDSDNNGENGGENTNTDNTDPNQGEDNTPSANV